jgi:hypothetical protein
VRSQVKIEKKIHLGVMSTKITITLPDEIYQRAESFARLANRDIASILADTLQLSIPPVSKEVNNLEPVSVLSDEQVLALTDMNRTYALTRNTKYG